MAPMTYTVMYNIVACDTENLHVIKFYVDALKYAEWTVENSTCIVHSAPLRDQAITYH